MRVARRRQHNIAGPTAAPNCRRLPSRSSRPAASSAATSSSISCLELGCVSWASHSAASCSSRSGSEANRRPCVAGRRAAAGRCAPLPAGCGVIRHARCDLDARGWPAVRLLPARLHAEAGRAGCTLCCRAAACRQRISDGAACNSFTADDRQPRCPVPPVAAAGWHQGVACPSTLEIPRCSQRTRGGKLFWQLSMPVSGRQRKTRKTQQSGGGTSGTLERPNEIGARAVYADWASWRNVHLCDENSS